MQSSTNFECLEFESDSSWEDVEEEVTLMETECHPLLQNSLILEKIFEFLPIPNLLTCRLVNQEWNKTVLLKKLLGSKLEITVSNANIDKLLKTGQNSWQPFCRNFEFCRVDLDDEKVSKFIRLFGNKLSNLKIKFCAASSAQSVMLILLNTPRLEELTIYGALPDIDEKNFHSFTFTRLKTLSLYGEVNRTFLEVIWAHAPNIVSVQIGERISLWIDFCSLNSAFNFTKLCHVGLSGIEGPLEIDFFPKCFTFDKISFQNCLIRPDFFEQFLLQTYRYLTVLNVEGTQQEILSKAFRDVTMPNLKQLILPIDGVSISDGSCILHSCPRLQKLVVSGLFETSFAFQDGRLLSVTFQENSFSTLFSRENLQNVIVHETKREFLKVLSLVQLQPQKVNINLPLCAKMIRAIYTHYPDVEHLKLVSSAPSCIVGLTGIPYRSCRRMAYCKSFSILQPHRIRVFPNVGNLKKLREFELTIVEDMPTSELTLLLVVYGISELKNLVALALNNLSISDVAFMILAQQLSLSSCTVNGSEDLWRQFLVFYKKHTIKSFLLPSQLDSTTCITPAEVVGRDSKMLFLIFQSLDSREIFEMRKVCKYWHSVVSEYRHKRCSNDGALTMGLEARLNRFHNNDKTAHATTGANYTNLFHVGMGQVSSSPRVLQLWESMQKETSIIIISLNKSVLEFLQQENAQLLGKSYSCQKRRQLEYWYYPDGTDDIIYRQKRESKAFDDMLKDSMSELDTLQIIGCWGRKDDGLLKFLNPGWSVGSVQLIGLGKEALDLVLPKMTVMQNLESLQIKPLQSSSFYELTKTHLQILCNASFKLGQLSMQFNAPPEAIVDFVRSQRFTLETVELRSNINISDRLVFSMPQLKILKLDEPPGCLLWSTLNMHASLETIGFGRTGCGYSQVKIKSSPKNNPLEADFEFEHSATEILCDVNWFVEASPTRRLGAQKSILQQGTDTALKFFTHFPFLSSLTLRGVHAHYGILQGIFKKFGQLKKLELINATGITDEILTGFSKEILDEMDIMNPFQAARQRPKNELHPRKGYVSIRQLKNLTHLSLDDQPSCTDFSIIFGILKLHHLQYFSCKKWKITDVSLRALADVLASLREVNTDGCATVSKFALEYFNESRACLKRSPFHRRCSTSTSSLSSSPSKSLTTEQ